MLRQLARLTRPLPAAGQSALALAVYTDPAGELVVAKESGFEGVACVDDAARVLDVLCDVWVRTHDSEVKRWARGLLEFVLWMQGDDGRWWNFVYDWSGTRNENGVTSSTGENFWHARALLGVSHAWLTFGDQRALEAMHRGLDHAVTLPAPADVRALHVLVGLRLLEEGSIPGIAPALHRWAEEIADRRVGDVLMNNPDERGEPHLWAHVQEGVLADAGQVLGDETLVDVARASAKALLAPIVRSGFHRPSVTPYDVACTVFSLDRLSRIGDGEWSELAMLARSWFDQVDRSGRPVYDREAGRVADGVDEGRVSENSGAEANLVAAEALFEDALGSVPAAVTLLPRPANG
ncbi:MAG TPA: hypothetical protein VFI59_05190 [Actinomycetota bacterium]|nr:hypothetical protein [Actinomycetota bacterium]